ncbi:MAG TPA: HepT-like ribonuclease domain-containing protein [Acidimicrobiales bacterium]|nr:HepT-like ribonuclease domain-containing protein [Acidimicrobiales bacterium]
MTRHDEEWLDDILDAINAIDEYLAIDGLQQGLIYDACRVRLMEIGEAVKHLDPALLELEPTIAWNEIARMRDVLVHHYHDTDFAVVEAVVTERLAPLRAAVLRLREIDPGN